MLIKMLQSQLINYCTRISQICKQGRLRPLSGLSVVIEMEGLGQVQHLVFLCPILTIKNELFQLPSHGVPRTQERITSSNIYWKTSEICWPRGGGR